MTQLPKTCLFAAVVIVLAFVTTPSAKADPLLFSNVVALQNNGLTQVSLFSNPGATLIGPQISFLVDVTGTLLPGTADTLMITYSEVGSNPILQSFEIPAFGTVQSPFTLLFTINSPGATSQGVMATLTLDILGTSPDFQIPGGPTAGQRVNSYTYSFNVSQPVPEPTAALLMGIGLVAVAFGIKRRRRKMSR